jgi:hypothetical protein
MLFWSIKITFISIILIFLVHHLINFFKSTLTVPKIKDLVNTPTQKYENMFNVISLAEKQNQGQKIANEGQTEKQFGYTEIDLLPRPDESSMKNELKSFLKKQLDTSVVENYSLKSFSETSSYSNF